MIITGETTVMETIFFYTNFMSYNMTVGITRKVYAQIEAFRELGFEVYYSGYLEDGVAVFDNKDKVVYFKKYPVGNKKIQHILRRNMLMNACIDYLKHNKHKFCFSYVRYHFFDRKYIQLLNALKENSDKVIIEAHSAPKFSKKLSPMLYVAWKDSIWNKQAAGCVDLVASMSDEDKLWGIDTIKISNGISVNDIRRHNYKGSKEDLNIIAVSFESAVHGYDRIIRGIKQYYGEKNIYFHIVGTVMNSTVRLIDELDLKSHCVLYGPLSGAELDDAYDNANIAAGCLANHRIGSFYGSALKTKEYIAKGIPFFYGWNEKVLENFPYAKHIELCEEPINMNEIIEFYTSLEKESLSEKMRNCLAYEDTWKYQMSVVTEAVKNI